MNDDCKVISKFYCYREPMVTVRIGNATHVMSVDDWKWFFGTSKA